MTEIRPAEPGDAEAIAAIYNEGIESRQATFVTRPRGAAEVQEWLQRRGPNLVAERDGQVVAFAVVGEYSEVPAYEGVGAFAIYVAGSAQGQGVGCELLTALCAASRQAGRFKLVGLLFADNQASRALCRACGFREVGVHERHGQLEGEWRDVVIVERLLDDA
jgi:L-amino acid N-acyltransferase YncA